MPAGAVTAPGWYGKLSMLGDFAHRRLEPGLLRRVDAWLAGWIAESRRELGDARWREGYLAAPLLRFAWTPGVAGPTGWAGVLMPSCDNAGRYFPLWVAEPCAVAALDAAPRQAWFDRVAAAATGTLDDGASVASFEAALAAATLPAGGVPPRAGRWAAAVVRGGAGPGVSHWWVDPDDEVTSLDGLPEGAALTSLLHL